MGIFRKQSTRQPLTTVLLELMLALSIAASSIGFAAWSGAEQQLENINKQYTTIAVPSGAGLEKMDLAGSTSFLGNGSKVYPDGTRYIGVYDAELTARKSKDYLKTDRRIYLSAHVEGGVTLSSGTNDPLQYNYTLDQYCYQLSVMALRCIGVEEQFYDWSRDRTYWAEFEIIDDVCRIDAYDLPPYDDKLYIESSLFTQEGEIPFEPGKSYLVRGMYWDYDVYSRNGEPVRNITGEFKPRTLLMDPEAPMMYNPSSDTGMCTGLPNWIMERRKYPDSDTLYYVTPSENCWPYFAEYTGQWEDYLETEAGQVWKQEIIPYCEQNHASVPVILTDDVTSMYFFNTGDASILKGGFFSEEDYAAGNAVCLISAAYANLNGLSVGDTVELDFYNTGYEQTRYPVLQGTGRDGLTVKRFPLSEKSRIDVKKTFTIVGIYTAPEWQAGAHSFHADTFFVPKASVPNADNYGGSILTMLNTVIIKNGSIEEFEAHMAAADKGGAYIYFDNGFTEAAAPVQTMIDNAMRLMLVGAAMFILASLLFLMLFARRASSVMRSMRLLGVPKRQTWLECLGNLFTQEIVAALLGNTLAVVLYEQITVQLLSGTPVLSLESVLIFAGVQLVALLLVGGVWMRMIAGRNLMQRRKEGGLRWKRSKAASCWA